MKVNSKDKEIVEFLNMYIIPVIAVILLLLLTVFVFYPKFQSISQNLQNTSALTDNQKILTENIQRLTRAADSNTYINNSIKKFDSIIPTEARVSEVASQLEQLARDSQYGDSFFVSAKAQENVDLNLNGKTVNTSLNKLPEGISSVNLVLTVQGTIDNIHKFTQSMVKLSRLITVNDINWSSTDGTAYVAQYTLTAYYGNSLNLNPIILKNISDEGLLSPMKSVNVDLNKKQIDSQIGNVGN